MVACRRSSFVVVPSMFVNMGTARIAADIPAEKVDSCCWMYSINDVEFGAHRPIFWMSMSLYPACLRAQAPPDRSECVSMRSMGIPKLG